MQGGEEPEVHFHCLDLTSEATSNIGNRSQAFRHVLRVACHMLLSFGMLAPTLSRLGRAAIDLLYPPRCALCGRYGAFVCAPCLDGLPRADGARCDRCWLPLQTCQCAERPLALSQLRSVYKYEGDVRRLVHRFKFTYHSALAESLAPPMASLLAGSGTVVDAIVSVALPASHQRERGFNQAALLADRIGAAAGLPVIDALTRRAGAHQARARNAEERWHNVEGAFSVRDASQVAGRRFVLVDDIATTGATLDAAAKALLAAGAVEVAGLTLARED
jgi:ComF family protein